MNSPEASPTPAPTMPGPTIRQIDFGGSGMSRTSTSGRCFVGKVGVKLAASRSCDWVLIRPLPSDRNCRTCHSP